MSRPVKRIPNPGFAGDQGAADPALAEALRAYAREPGRLPEVLAALHTARVLAPVVAVLGETGATEAGLTVDKSADIALPLLQDGDGARAVPVFSSVQSLAAWDPQARPVPVLGPRAAAVALAEGARGLLVDPAGPHRVSLGAAEVHALAEGRGAVPVYADEAAVLALHRALAELPAVADVAAAWCEPWPGSDARVTVVADPRQSALVAAAVRAALAGAMVRGIELGLAAPGQAGPVPPGVRRVYTRR